MESILGDEIGERADSRLKMEESGLTGEEQLRWKADSAKYAVRAKKKSERKEGLEVRGIIF